MPWRTYPITFRSWAQMNERHQDELAAERDRTRVRAHPREGTRGVRGHYRIAWEGRTPLGTEYQGSRIFDNAWDAALFYNNLDDRPGLRNKKASPALRQFGGQP